MTALNVILRSDAAYLITDGLTQELGKPEIATPKVIALPHLDAALSARGSFPLLPVLYNLIVYHRRTFADAAAHLGEDLRAATAGLRRVAPDLPGHDVALVGWPASGPGPECWVAVDHDRWGPPPFDVLQVPGVLSPNDGSLAARLGGRDLLADDASFDPDREAAALVRAQAEMPGSGVGAFVQVTKVQRGRIETRILDRWVPEGGTC